MIRWLGERAPAPPRLAYQLSLQQSQQNNIALTSQMPLSMHVPVIRGQRVIPAAYGCSALRTSQSANQCLLIGALRLFQAPFELRWTSLLRIYIILLSVFLPGESPWTEGSGGLQSMGSQRVVPSERLSTHTGPWILGRAGQLHALVGQSAPAFPGVRAETGRGHCYITAAVQVV